MRRQLFPTPASQHDYPNPVLMGAGRFHLEEHQTPAPLSPGAGWTDIIGIPTPPIGVTEIVPAVPTPWDVSTAGFYYVKAGGLASNNGTPANPRSTFPNPIPAGAVVVLDNTTFLGGVNWTLNFAGVSGNLAWCVSSGLVGVTGTTAQAQLRHTGTVFIHGSYFIVDGLDIFATAGGGDNVAIGGGGSVSFGCVRNSTIRGNGASQSSNNANSINSASNVVLKNVDVKDQGNWQFVGADIDCHGMAGFGGSDIWVVDSRFYHNQGDGIQLNVGAPNENNASAAQRIYIGRNEFYQNLQTGCWLKNGQDVIISENKFHNHTDGGGSAPINTGGQYLFTRAWWLYNQVYDGTTGIGIASSNGQAFTRDIYLIGNVITNHTGDAIHTWMGDKVTVLHNTIYTYGVGFSASPNSGLNLIFENNVLWNRTNGSGYEVETESTSIAEKVKKNMFPASPRFNLNGTLTTSLASMESASPTNRTGNVSGSNPLFVNPLASGIGNYHLGAGSAGIDAGNIYAEGDPYTTFQTLYGLDIRKDSSGTVRPQNGTWDIGALETVP